MISTLSCIAYGRALSLSVLILGCLAPPSFAKEPVLCSEQLQSISFLIGEWKVRSSTGGLLGTNSISPVAGSCAILESWTSADRQTTGTSLTFFDQRMATYRQVWVDMSGATIELEGSLDRDKLVMLGTRFSTRLNRVVLERIEWTPTGEVGFHQKWMSSADGGSTWDTIFDGSYTIANESPLDDSDGDRPLSLILPTGE